MAIFRSVRTSEEQMYERNLISSQSDRYLSTDVLQKVRSDGGYAAKVRLVEDAIGRCNGLILDIGANTCGEAEYLTTRGYTVVATDINEVALGLSYKRCERFERVAPMYLACDGHCLPLREESAQCVIFNESLHHMEDPLRALRECYRVLIPGGKVFLYEPYAYNPYRRLSEIRDRFRGTIERSFGVSKLQMLLKQAGLVTVSLERNICPPSEWKMDSLHSTHKLLRRLYFAISRALPSIFGNLMVLAVKPGVPAERTT